MVISGVMLRFLTVTATFLLWNELPVWAVAAFMSRGQRCPQTTLRVTVQASAGRRGGGMGLASLSSKKKGKKKKKSPSTTSSPFDANASLLRLEKRYEDLTLATAKKSLKVQESSNEYDDAVVLDDHGRDFVTAQYIVAARCPPAVADWAPIAQLCLCRDRQQADTSEGASDPSVSAAVSYYCRELGHVAGLGSRVFSSVPRNQLQYAVEPVDSFHKYVYEVVMEGKNEDADNNQVMTKSKAREVLQLSSDCMDMGEIKRAYRTLSFAYHPDRLVGCTNQCPDKAAEHYAQIRLAFETLSSGILCGSSSSSWYETLGGRARSSDFVGPLRLMSIGAAEKAMASNQLESALVGLDPDMVQAFVARSLLQEAHRRERQ